MGVRDENRAAVEAAILRVGREHLGRYGAAALSLRAVARDLGMVSSGIYRYVEGRDELLTRLIIHAYTALAAEVTAAHDRIDPEDLGGRWDAIGRALRHWALTHPHDYALIYGSPVPDYSAPAERTSEPGTAVLLLITRLLDAIARRSNAFPHATTGQNADQALAERAVGDLLADQFFEHTTIDAGLLARGLSAWTLILGAVSSEVFGQLGEVGDAESLFEWHLATARRHILPG